MGWETLIFAAFTGLKAVSQMNAAKKEAKATVREGELVAKEKAKEVRQKVARQTVSFLNSGLTLDGTAQDILGETYSTGIADINNIRTNYTNKGKSQIAAGRTAAIGTIASAAGGMAAGSMGSMFETAGSYLPESASFGLNKMGFGNEAYNMLDLKDARA